MCVYMFINNILIAQGTHCSYAYNIIYYLLYTQKDCPLIPLCNSMHLSVTLTFGLSPAPTDRCLNQHYLPSCEAMKSRVAEREIERTGKQPRHVRDERSPLPITVVVCNAIMIMIMNQCG